MTWKKFEYAFWNGSLKWGMPGWLVFTVLFHSIKGFSPLEFQPLNWQMIVRGFIYLPIWLGTGFLYGLSLWKHKDEEGH